MSSGQYCLIRDLGLVKGGKGLRHHEVVLTLSWRGVIGFLIAVARETWARKGRQKTADQRPADMIRDNGVRINISDMPKHAPSTMDQTAPHCWSDEHEQGRAGL